MAGVGNRQRGVTLIELVVVIVIFAILLGLAVAMFRGANRDLGVRAATHHAVTLLRSAAEAARSEASPTEVVCDIKDNAIHTLTKETLGMWHLEDDQGAFGRRATMSNVRTAPGYVGNGQAFPRGATINCGALPVNVKDAGVAIDFYLMRPTLASGHQTICTVGKGIELYLEGNGRLIAKAGQVQVQSGDYYLNKPDHWYYVQFVSNTLESKLYVNDVEVGTRAGRAEWGNDATLTLGSGKEGFVGILDEFRISLIIPRDVYTLPAETKMVFPQGTVFREQRYFVFWFNPQGRLDPTKHTAAVTFTLKSPADEKRITVTLQGDVNR
jgi:prepilin-type N-terminal cleavage/methylation domain-containing protein